MKIKTQEIYGVPKGVTEIHIDGGLHYGLYTKDGEPEFISISLPDTEEKAPTQFAYDAACTALHKHRERCTQLEAELAEAVDILRQWGNMFEGGGICGTLKILRDANNAFLARHGDKS